VLILLAIQLDITRGLDKMTSRIEILRTELANTEYADLVTAQNYPAIANLLNNRPLIPNPDTQTEVPKIPTIEEVATLVKSARSVCNIRN
jgi:HAMP domain-containing protein